MSKKKEPLIENTDEEIIFPDYPDNFVPRTDLIYVQKIKNALNKQIRKKLHRNGKNISQGIIENVWFTGYEIFGKELLTLMDKHSFGTALAILDKKYKIQRMSLNNTIPDWAIRREKHGEENYEFRDDNKYQYAIKFLQLRKKNFGKRD